MVYNRIKFFIPRLICSFIILIFLLNLSCNNHPNSIEEEKPGRRDYIWTIDTISYPGSWQTIMLDIWGSSPNDVYVVGHNDGGYGKMFRFNGNNWSEVDLGEIFKGGIDLTSIHGFSKNDIWVVGERIYVNPNRPPNFLDSSLIINYDGVSWKEHKVKNGGMLLGIWGSSSKDIWTGGLRGTIFYYDGGKWIKHNYDEKIWFNCFAGLGSNRYALAYKLDEGVLDTTWQYFLQWKNNNWGVIDYFLEVAGYSPKFGIGSLTAISNELYSCGRGVFKYGLNGWEKIFNPPNVYFRGVFGTNSKNIFVVGNDLNYYLRGVVYHFNGTDWYEITGTYDFPDVAFNGIWMDGKEVFIVGQTYGSPQVTIIFRGK